MSYGLTTYNTGGILTFDSTAEFTLFLIDERSVPASSVGAGISFTYPAYAGKKIVANMVSPYGGGTIDGMAVLSCRVSYVGTTPKVDIFVDNSDSTLPRCDGYLLVFSTGQAL